jgi:uncharacterized protein (TIRG00374 family)
MKLKYAMRLVGVVLFIFICIKVGLKDCWENLKQIKLIYFCCSIGLGFVVIAVRTSRWMQILRFFKISFPFRQSYKLSLIGNSLASLTPGRLGEIVKPYCLYKSGYSFLFSLKSIILDRLCDLSTVCVLGFLSLIYYRFINFSYIQASLLSATALAVAILLLKLWKRYQDTFWSLILQHAPNRWRAAFSENDEHEKLSCLLRNDWHILLITSLTAFFGTCLKFYCLLLALDIRISFLVTALMMALVMLSRLLPISILNLGSREAILIFMFALEGLTQENALSFSLLILADMLFFVIVGQIVTWTNYPSLRKESWLFDNPPSKQYS